MIIICFTINNFYFDLIQLTLLLLALLVCTSWKMLYWFIDFYSFRNSDLDDRTRTYAVILLFLSFVELLVASPAVFYTCVGGIVCGDDHRLGNDY